MRILYPDDIKNSFNEVYAEAAPFMYLNEDKMEWDFVEGTPSAIKDKYYALITRVHDFEDSIMMR